MKPNQTTKDRIKQSRKIIQETIAKLGEHLEQGYSTEMTRYLKTMALFHTYSTSNQFLILAQRPEATQVAGFQTWKRLHRSIKRGEKAVRVLAPVCTKKKTVSIQSKETKQEDSKVPFEEDTIHSFRVVCVFDLAQTHGSKLPEPFRAQGEARQRLSMLEQAVRNNGIQLDYGYAGRAYGYSKKGSITIKKGMDSAETFAVLAHEFAHELLHQRQTTNDSRPLRELEAEAVACVVCERFSVQAIQASSDYIRLWEGDKNKLLNRLEKIRRCASTIITQIESLTKEGKKSQPMVVD